MEQAEQETRLHIEDFLRGETMSIAVKLSWELVALSDRGVGEGPERLTAEIAYGVARQIDQPDLFSAVMSSIIMQVSDEHTKHLLRQWTARGLKK
jgi:hypothetical protein